MDYEQFALDVYKPVVESAMVVASEYCNATGRTIVVSKDIEMGMKFAARHILGTCTGTLFPEISDESDNDDDDVSTVSEDDIDEAWTRYNGDDARLIKINECFDTWAQWEPDTPIGHALKSAIEKSIGSV